MRAHTSRGRILQSIAYLLVLTGSNSRTYLPIGIEGAGYRIREPIQANRLEDSINGRILVCPR